MFLRCSLESPGEGVGMGTGGHGAELGGHSVAGAVPADLLAGGSGLSQCLSTCIAALGAC